MKLSCVEMTLQVLSRQKKNFLVSNNRSFRIIDIFFCCRFFRLTNFDWINNNNELNKNNTTIMGVTLSTKKHICLHLCTQLEMSVDYRQYFVRNRVKIVWNSLRNSTFDQKSEKNQLKQVFLWYFHSKLPWELKKRLEMMSMKIVDFRNL